MSCRIRYVRAALSSGIADAWRAKLSFPAHHAGDPGRGHRRMQRGLSPASESVDARPTATGSRPMLGLPKPRRLGEPIAVSLEPLAPAHHFYRHLEAHLHLSFVCVGSASGLPSGG
jgi:hypothetical protein